MFFFFFMYYGPVSGGTEGKREETDVLHRGSIIFRIHFIGRYMFHIIYYYIIITYYIILCVYYNYVIKMSLDCGFGIIIIFLSFFIS